MPTRPRLVRRLLSSLLLLGTASLAHAQIPAFPGAEGYGAYSTGGRGGDVYHVTNLNASGTGSFFDAIATVPSAGRTIVFDVSGYIRIPSGSGGTRMTKSKVTIAGQTAPGDGIGFYNNVFRISGSDVVLRHLRFRLGKYGTSGDCIDLDSGCTNAMLDHLSMQFSQDENISSYSTPPENLTLQYSLNSWGLETHSCGGLWDQNHATAHHTLWSHNHTRNPKARPNGLLEWINNVSFDWDIGFIMGDTYTPSTFKANVRSNYFICPPGNIKTYMLEKGWLDRNAPRKPTFSIFLDNNLMDRDGDGLLNGLPAGYERVQGSEFDSAEVVDDYATNADVPRYYKNATPFAGSTAGVVIDTPRMAYKKVVSSAGALRLDATYGAGIRDEVDTLLVNKLVTQTPAHVTHESDIGASAAGFGVLNSTSVPLDTDRDGMPDVYETPLGWTPATADNNTALASSGGILTGTTFFPVGTVAGYTRLEEYLHFLASPHATIAKNTGSPVVSFTVDLSRYTQGFNNLSPTFTVANVIGGTAVQSGTGGATVTFTPTANVTGRARFEFTVTDSQGDVWTQSMLLLVSSISVPKDLVWKGDGTVNAWNTSALNWTKSDGSSVAFSASDNALFDDRGSASPALAVAANVSAGTVTVDSTQNYTISGAGSVLANGPLTKRGTGSLTLNTANNSFSSITHEAGTLVLGTATAAGSAKIKLNGGTLNLSPSPAAAIANALEFNAPTTLNVTVQHDSTGLWTGSGDVTINTSAMWTIYAAWSGYSGRITLGSTGTPRVRLNGTTNSNYGSAALAIDLGQGSGQFYNRNGDATTPFAIGTLTGGSNTQLQGTQTGTVVSTYSIGARNENAAFAGILANGIAGGLTHITKVGTGTWTLTGASTHTGNTTVSAGGLRLNGSFTTSPITVATGATLSGTGTTGGLVTVQSGGKLSPGATDGAAGTFTATAGLNASSGSTLVFDLGPTPASTSDKITVSGGTFTLGSALNAQINLLDYTAGLTPGTYSLVGGNSTLSASSSVVTLLMPVATGTTRQTFAIDRPASGTNPAYLNLVVTGSAAPLVWSGVSGGIWDLNTTAGNFTGGSPSVFYNLDQVTFNDTSPGGSVVLAGTIQPAIITVNNSTSAYSFDGSGVIGGLGRLVKSGSGTLTLAGTSVNTFTGGVDLSGGTLQLAGATSPLGTGLVTVSGGTLGLGTVPLANSLRFTGNSSITSAGNVALATGTGATITSTGTPTINLSGLGGIFTLEGNMAGFAGTLSLGSNGSMIRLNGNGSSNLGSASTHFALGTGSGKLTNRNGGLTIELGAVSGGSSTALSGRQSGSGTTATVYRVGGLNLDTTFAGAIQTGGDLAGVQIVKTGTGVWTLSGASDYTGGLAVETGRVILSGTLACTGNAEVSSTGALQLSNGILRAAALDVDAAGVVTGLGLIDGDLNNHGTLSASGVGSVTITGDVVNDGVIRLTGGAELIIAGTVVNNGLLDLMTAGGILPPNLINNGTVLDASAVKLLSWSQAGTAFTLTIASYSGHNYTLQVTDDLAAGWTNVETRPGVTGQNLVFTHDGGSLARRFYRFSVE
jgi:autotransporter-associated beta strand protein